MGQPNEQLEKFSQRLRELMRAKGHVSATSKSGVDVAELARVAETSYEMARRYAEGIALPRPDKMKRIAAWLGVTPGLLAWGQEAEEEPPHDVDPETLAKCIEAVMNAQSKLKVGGGISLDRAAALVAILYPEAKEGRFPVQTTVDRMLKALA